MFGSSIRFRLVQVRDFDTEFGCGAPVTQDEVRPILVSNGLKIGFVVDHPKRVHFTIRSRLPHGVATAVAVASLGPRSEAGVRAFRSRRGQGR